MFPSATFAGEDGAEETSGHSDSDRSADGDDESGTETSSEEEEPSQESEGGVVDAPADVPARERVEVPPSVSETEEPPPEVSVDSQDKSPEVEVPAKQVRRLGERPNDGYRQVLTALSVSIGGGLLASQDSGYAALRGDGDMNYHQVELGALLLPRLGVAASVMWTDSGGARLSGPYDESGAAVTDIAVDPQLTSWDISARLIPTPPFFPVRGYFRLGGGAHHLHVRVTDDSLYDNIAQRDERGIAGFAILGAGAEVSSPTAVRDRSVPVTAALVLEGGVRIGGGGELVAAPSADLGNLGRLDLGPWYFRAAFKVSFWPRPKLAGSSVIQ